MVKKVIHSIIPAQGWYASYNVEDCKVVVDPVAVWAHCTEYEDGEDHHFVEGLVDNGCGLDSAEKTDNFSSYLSKEEVDQIEARGGIEPREL